MKEKNNVSFTMIELEEGMLPKLVSPDGKEDRGGKTVRVSWKVTISPKYQFVPRTIVVRWMPLPTGNKENFCTKYTAYHPLEKSVAIVRRYFFQLLLWDSIPSILAPIFKEILLLTSRVPVHPEFSFQPRFLFEPISVD